MTQPMFDNKPGHFLTEDEIKEVYSNIMIMLDILDRQLEKIGKLPELKKVNINELRDSVDFIARETYRLNQALIYLIEVKKKAYEDM